ncbi:MAG TPA: alanine racemase [Desulfobacteraceae bacterium]|nr:alanine racemase [Desulfobacteraceae bacterium]
MDFPLVKAEIDLTAIAGNIQALKKITDEKSEFMAVVKADGYGHGAVEVARKAAENKVDRLGVARLHEAETLRRGGITLPILIFGYTWPEQCTTLAELDIAATVYDLETAQILDAAARKKGIRVRVHLKVDTGMGRVGMVIPLAGTSPEIHNKAAADVGEILKLRAVELEGIYTHFAEADSFDKTYTLAQIDTFSTFLDTLKKNGITLPICHAANSAGIIDLPGSHFDMVRAGIAIYGLYPSGEVNRSRACLTPAMTLKTMVTFTKNVPRGFKVSYGTTYETETETVIASIPVGYADGYSRLLSSNGQMLVRGEKAPIAGRVCMDQTLIDVGHIPGVKPGDEVVLLGRQQNSEITAEEIAAQTDTINYEVVSALTSRIPRVFYSLPSPFSG